MASASAPHILSGCRVLDFTQGVAFREVADSPQLKLEETA